MLETVCLRYSPKGRQRKAPPPYFAEGRYQDALVELAELREPVDAFFDKVMVMVDDKELRINRLTMLEKLRELFLRVADISLLQ